MGWWENAWLSDPALQTRFERETTAALPVSSNASTEDVFAGLEWRRLRLRQDQVRVAELPARVRAGRAHRAAAKVPSNHEKRC